METLNPNQVLCALAVSCGQAMVSGWISFSGISKMPEMANLTGPEDPVHLDLGHGSWLASLFLMGNIAGCLAAGMVYQVVSFNFLNYYQRIDARKAFWVSAPLAASTWIMTVTSQRTWTILASR